jgi:hypothetical protein
MRAVAFDSGQDRGSLKPLGVLYVVACGWLGEEEWLGGGLRLLRSR